MGDNLHVGIEFGNCATGGFHFGLTDRGLTVNNLALEIGFIHAIEIDDAEATYSSSSEIGEKRRAEAACADGENAGGLELSLTFDCDFGHDEMAGVAPHFWGAEFLGTGCLGNARNQRHRTTLVKKGFWVEYACVIGRR